MLNGVAVVTVADSILLCDLYKEIKLILDYKQHKLVENTIKQYNGKIIDSNFEENINMRVNIPYKDLKEYKKILTEKSNGTIEVEE